ncbi:hypothetical protein BDD12DRAFT_482026 [Trichophaea hybrida]|nr:hypothetical protein BDD12DRAFT_482026 [Trichophaea hybrida]
MIGDDVTPNNNVGGIDCQSSEFGPVGFVNVESGDETSDPLIVVSNVSLESSLAQHIFSSFMWAIANDIPAEKLKKGETSIARGDLFQMDDPDTLLSVKFENKVLTGIANTIQRTELGTLEDVYISIIPPLSGFRKLPIEPVIEFIWQQMRDHELRGRWEKVVPVCIRLFQECKTWETHRIFHKATAI